MANEYFTRIPDALYDALRDGEITRTMFEIMMHLHHWADWDTGVVRTVNAKRLRAAMGGHHDEEVASERTVQRALQGLDEAGWIISGYVRGMKQPYGVALTNYQPVADKDAEKALINPTDTKHWKETKAFQGAEQDAEKALTKAVRRRLKERESLPESSTPDSSPESLNPVLVSKQAGRASGSATPHPTEESGGDENQKPMDSVEEAKKVIRDYSLVSDSNQRFVEQLMDILPMVLGVQYITQEHMEYIAWICTANWHGKWDADHVGKMFLWAMAHKFWKTRVVDLRTFTQALQNQDEKGLASQYARHLKVLDEKEEQKDLALINEHHREVMYGKGRV